MQPQSSRAANHSTWLRSGDVFARRDPNFSSNLNLGKRYSISAGQHPVVWVSSRLLRFHVEMIRALSSEKEMNGCGCSVT